MVALITGGKINAGELRGRGSSGLLGGLGRGRGIGEGGRRGGLVGGLGGGLRSGERLNIKKYLKKNVLYLLVVDMPSEEEMAAARESQR